MNASHKTNLKLNHYKRLTRKLKEVPTDGNKTQRKQELAYELGKEGVKV